MLPFFSFLNQQQPPSPFKGSNGFAKGPEWAFKCGSFEMSVGPSKIFDEADGDNKLEKIEKRNRHGKIPCKTFSKYLIVKTIG